MAENPRLGRRIRALRRESGMTQRALAEELGISGSYLNLIEHERRPVSAALLLKLAGIFDTDLRAFSLPEASRVRADLREVFGDPVFEEQPLSEDMVRDFVDTHPEVAQAVVQLFHAFDGVRSSTHELAEHVLDRQDLAGVDRQRMTSEQVSDLIERHRNYFPELEAEAERVWRDGGLEDEDLFAGLVGYLESVHGVSVDVRKVQDMGGAVRRFDGERRELLLSEVLRRGSRNFQLAHQIGLLNCSDAFDRVAGDPQLTSDASRKLCRVALANYFAAAVLMPYDQFLRTAEDERYDIDLLGHRFRSSFEQVVQRLTSLHRKGAEGVRFSMVRIDIAGNISKRFSSTGVPFPRFSGLCPLWNVHAAFLQPGRVRVQVSRLPDNTPFFSVARTVRKHRGGYKAPNVLHAIELSCDVESARRLVYADGVDLSHAQSAVPLGSTCRLCDRMDCQARAFPSLQRPLEIDENLRGVSFFTPVEELP